MITNAFALTGRIVICDTFTQGAALGYVLLPLRGVLLVSLAHILILSYWVFCLLLLSSQTFTCLYRNLSRAVAAVVMFVIHHAELSRCHSMNGIVRVNHQSAVVQSFDGGRMIIGRMAYLERHTVHRNFACQEVEVVYGEIFFVCSLRVVAVTYVENVVLYVLLDYKPRSATESQALALAYSVKPQSAMFAYAFARFHLDNVAWTLAQVSAYVFIIVYLTEEADALRVFALGINKMFALGYGTHLVLLVMAYGEYRLLMLS